MTQYEIVWHYIGDPRPVVHPFPSLAEAEAFWAELMSQAAALEVNDAVLHRLVRRSGRPGEVFAGDAVKQWRRSE